MPSTLVRSHSSRIDDGTPEIFVVAERAAGEPWQLDGGEEAVADAQRVGGLRLLGAGERAPVGANAGMHDLLDASLAFDANDEAAIAERDAPP